MIKRLFKFLSSWFWRVKEIGIELDIGQNVIKCVRYRHSKTKQTCTSSSYKASFLNLESTYLRITQKKSHWYLPLLDSNKSGIKSGMLHDDGVLTNKDWFST